MSCRCGRHNNDTENAPLAQLVEHLTLNQGIYAKKEPSPELLSLQKRFSRVHRQGLEPWTP